MANYPCGCRLIRGRLVYCENHSHSTDSTHVNLKQMVEKLFIERLDLIEQRLDKLEE